MLATKNNFVSVLQLKRLLHALVDSRPDICIRFRFIGQMWQTNHCRVVQIGEKGIVLNDEQSNKMIIIHQLNNVMQFELDRAFQQYEPHFHYNVDPDL